MNKKFGFDDDCEESIDRVGHETRTQHEGYCLLGDGIASISFDVVLDGQDFTYIDGDTGLESANITYDHSTGWIIPNNTRVYDILFQGTAIEEKPIYFCTESAGSILLDSSGNGRHATIFNGSSANWDNQIYRSDLNIYGYTTKAHYTALGLDWELPDGTVLDDNLLMPRGLWTWVPLLDSNGEQQVDSNGEDLYVRDPYTGGRDGL